MAAIYRSSTALQIVKNNASAWAIFTSASSEVMGKTVAELAGLNPSSYADMAAIASSQTAMTAVAASSTAKSAIVASTTAKAALNSSPLLESVSVTQSGTTAGTVYSGTCWIYTWTQNAANAGTFEITGGHTGTYSNTGASTRTVSDFFTAAKIARTSGSSSYTHTFKIIKC